MKKNYAHTISKLQTLWNQFIISIGNLRNASIHNRNTGNYYLIYISFYFIMTTVTQWFKN